MARFLLIDDAPARELLARHLSALGHCCDGAEVGADAFERLGATEYDALVVNGGVVGETAPARIWDGPRVAQAARGITRGRIPVIFSGASRFLHEQIQEISRLGLVDLVLPRPWAGDRLEWTITHALELRREWLERRLTLRGERARVAAKSGAPVADVPPGLARRRRVRERALRSAFRAAGHRLPKTIHWRRSPCEGLACVAEHVGGGQPSTSALRVRLAPALGGPDPGAAHGSGSSADGGPLHRWIPDDLAERIHALPANDRDAPLLALLWAIPGSPGAHMTRGPSRLGGVRGLLADIRRSVGCLWALDDGFTVATDRPVGVHRDRAGRVHDPERPAIEYGDGSGVYALQGRRVPAPAVLRARNARIADLPASLGERRATPLEHFESWSSRRAYSAQIEGPEAWAHRARHDPQRVSAHGEPRRAPDVMAIPDPTPDGYRECAWCQLCRGDMGCYCGELNGP